jgi:hypothetical protein
LYGKTQTDADLFSTAKFENNPTKATGDGSLDYAVSRHAPILSRKNS